MTFLGTLWIRILHWLFHTPPSPSRSSRDLAVEAGVPNDCWIHSLLHLLCEFSEDGNRSMMDGHRAGSSWCQWSGQPHHQDIPFLGQEEVAECFYDPTPWKVI